MEALDFLKELKRMCDSSRKYYTGPCGDCPLYAIAKIHGTCFYFIENYPEKAIEVVEEWSKEHLIKTNADKFKEVFGYDLEKSSCPCTGLSCPSKESACTPADCPCYGFWDKPYKEKE